MYKLPVNCLIYDGDCPVCNRYSRYVMLKKVLKNFQLVNARQDKKMVKFFYKKGLDLNNGMVLKVDNKLYYGGEAIHQISVLIGENDSGWHKYLFSNIERSKTVYPILVQCRKVILKILAKKPL